MHAVLMWTISDFPAYGMLSGWTTHGKLSCPHCQDSTDAYQLKHGRKTCWFDCHRRFLPSSHPYRRIQTLFTKGKVVHDPPPPELDGNYLLRQLGDFGADTTAECGGNGHGPVDTDLPGPYPTYKHLPRDAKTRWFRAFAVLNLSL